MDKPRTQGPDSSGDPEQAPPPDNKTGPGRPPLETRWQKGCPSPNPAGRPPKKHLARLSAKLNPLAAEIIEFDSKSTGAVDHHGDPVTRGGAFLATLHKRALSDQRAAEQYERIRRSAYEEEKNFNQSVLDAAVHLQHRFLKMFLDHEREGLPLPEIYPDPRDVRINGDGTVDITGPMNVLERRRMHKALKLRDRYLEQIDMIVLTSETDRAFFTKVRDVLRRKIYRLHEYIPPRLRKRIPSLRDKTRKGRAKSRP